MTEPDVFDGEIADAMTDLRIARAAWERSPNAESTRAKEDAERWLNRLLEVRYVLR